MYPARDVSVYKHKGTQRCHIVTVFLVCVLVTSFKLITSGTPVVLNFSGDGNGA
jgi:hypothetical protein